MDSNLDTDLPQPLLEDASTVAVSRPIVRRWVLAAGLVAGLGTWLLGETKLVRPPAAVHEMTVMGHTFESSTPTTRKIDADSDAMRYYGVLGASLGLMLGLAGGFHRRSPRAAAASALLGAVGGALCGVATKWGALPLYHRLVYTVSNDLIASLAVHIPPMTLAGAAGGLALGAALGGRMTIARAVLGGALGGLFGAVVFEFIGALAFPSSETGHPIASTASARLLAPMIVSTLATLGALLAVTPARSRKPVSNS